MHVWSEVGSWLATSAFETGVDPSIFFALHVDIPYGMIDSTQEFGRTGRFVEDVYSMVTVKEGKAERRLAGCGRGRNVRFHHHRRLYSE